MRSNNVSSEELFPCVQAQMSLRKDYCVACLNIQRYFRTIAPIAEIRYRTDFDVLQDKVALKRKMFAATPERT